MVYLNRNVTLNQLKEVVQKNINHKIDYMSDDFNKEQKQALELFQKRIFLEEVIEETVSFNKKLSWDNPNPNLNLTTTAEDLIEVFKLRSDVYASINYLDEFKDGIEGLNFDKFDKNSAIIYHKTNNCMTGSIRVIFDSKHNLPTEEKFSFENERKKHTDIAEVSRLVVKHKSSGLDLNFKYLMAGLHNTFINNDIKMTLFGIKKEHYKLYSKLGGVTIIKELDSYGSINVPFLIVSWDLSLVSKLFKRSFLNLS